MEKKRWYSSSLLAAVLLCSSLSATAQVSPDNFNYLYRLVGTWSMRTPQSVITEQWQRVNDTTLQGHTWRIVGKDSSLQATMQLVRTGNDIYYIPTIRDQNNGQPVPFKLRVLKLVGFIAENPAHDFPKKITYRFKDEDHLDARVEGKQGNTTGEVIFRYERK
jgi:Domain of unknown function (DUF6265)